MRSLIVLACLALASAPLQAVGSPGPLETSSVSSTPSAKPAHHRKRKRPHHPREIGQKAPTSDRISEIQSALSRSGYYQGDPSGKWDSNTVASLQKFQSANGIEANGKLDAPTLQKLGLGSDTAGVFAPRPVVPGSLNPILPSTAPQTPAAAPSPQTSVSAGGPVASVNSSAVEQSSSARASNH
jgi:peptidoglycan hydrolase-like protein with peptidoglycan-binding domain